jgi:hypothetical protein
VIYGYSEWIPLDNAGFTALSCNENLALNRTYVVVHGWKISVLSWIAAGGLRLPCRLVDVGGHYVDLPNMESKPYAE